MNLEFAQSSHDSTSAAFAEKLDAINRSPVFIPTPLHIKVMNEFMDGHHRLTYLTSTFPERLSLRPSVAAMALEELCDVGFMGFYPSAHKYALIKRGRDYMLMLDAPVETGIKAPPRTYVNATTKSVYSSPKINLRPGCQDHLMIKSLPMGKQLQMVAS